MAPRNLGRFARSRLLTLGLSFCLTFVTLVPLGTPHAESSGGFSIGGGKSFSFGGDPYSGSFGSFYSGGGNSELFSMKVDGGGGIDLGCGSLDMFAYMKAAFNVSDIADQLKAALQTMLAKMLMTYLMSFPQIAAVFDTINALLDARFTMFQQSCDLGSIRAKAKQEIIDACNKQHAIDKDDIKLKQCVEGASPMQSFINNQLKDLAEVQNLFNKDPVGKLQGTICDDRYDSDSAKQNPACLFLSFAPRFCFESSASKQPLCTGPKQWRAPINAAGVAETTKLGAEKVFYAGYNVTKEALRAGATEDDLRLAAARAFRKMNENANKSAQIDTISGNKLALFNLKMMPAGFGEDSSNPQSSQELIKEFNKTVLNLDDKSPLLKPYYAVEALAEELSAMGFNVTPPTDEGINFAEYFDFPPEASKRSGLNPKAAAQLMQNTLAANLNQQGFSSPVILVEVAITGNEEAYKSRFSLPIMCKSVNQLYSFMKGKVNEGEARFKAAAGSIAGDGGNIPGTKSTATDGSGNDVSVGKDAMKASQVKDSAEATFKLLNERFDGIVINTKAACDSMKDNSRELQDLMERARTRKLPVRADETQT